MTLRNASALAKQRGFDHYLRTNPDTMRLSFVLVTSEGEIALSCTPPGRRDYHELGPDGVHVHGDPMASLLATKKRLVYDDDGTCRDFPNSAELLR
jgi:hypothetical protein